LCCNFGAEAVDLCSRISPPLAEVLQRCLVDRKQEALRKGWGEPPEWYATLSIAKGDNILDVSKQLGHHSPKLTLDVYADWIPG
jgi:integrase